MNTIPQQPKRKLKAVAALFTALPAQEKLGTERELVQLYLMAVEDIPEAWVEEAAKRFIQGRVVRANVAFRPSPPELAVEARRLMERAAELARPSPRDVVALPNYVPPDWEPDAERRREFIARIFKEADVKHLMDGSFADPPPKPAPTWTREELAASRDRLIGTADEEDGR